MVPRVAGKGRSFKGAGLYYLHDKKARTSERVAFTETHNLPTDNPERAMRFMAHTAQRQAELKLAAGIPATGRKLTQSVYVYSLAWHPEEQPDRGEMLAAAQDTLKVLGLEEHEAVLVAHNDEPHPHIHVIVNRVHPRTGKAAGLSCDHLTLSRWAEDYERRQGQIRCAQRPINNAERRRRKGSRGGRDESGFVKDRSLDTATFRRWRAQRLKAAFDRRQSEQRALSARHAGHRQALHEEKERRIDDLRDRLRQEFKPEWAALFQQQRAEQRELKKARTAALSRLRYYLRHRDRHESGLLAGAINALLDRAPLEKKLAERHQAARRDLAARVREKTREAIRHETAHYRRELGEVERLQRQERETLSQAHAKENRDIARESASGADKERFRRETPRQDDRPPEVREEFAKRVGTRIRKARKQREERGKGVGRERGE